MLSPAQATLFLEQRNKPTLDAPAAVLDAAKRRRHRAWLRAGPPLPCPTRHCVPRSSFDCANRELVHAKRSRYPRPRATR